MADQAEHVIELSGGFDYDFYVECNTCQAELLHYHNSMFNPCLFTEIQAIVAEHVNGGKTS